MISGLHLDMPADEKQRRLNTSTLRTLNKQPASAEGLQAGR